MNNKVNQIVAIGKALSDVTRVNVLLFVRESGELSCQELSKKFNLSQPTLSHHIRKLINANLLSMRKVGVNNLYTVNESFLKVNGIRLDKLLTVES